VIVLHKVANGCNSVQCIGCGSIKICSMANHGWIESWVVMIRLAYAETRLFMDEAKVQLSSVSAATCMSRERQGDWRKVKRPNRSHTAELATWG
jgi:hypothetical protein